MKRLGVGDLNPVSRGSGCDAPVAPATYLLYFLHGLRRSFIFSFTPERKDRGVVKISRRFFEGLSKINTMRVSRTIKKERITKWMY